MSRRALRAQTRMVSDFCTGVLHWFRTGFCTGQNSFALGNYRAGSTYPDFYAYVCAREEYSASPWSFALRNRAMGSAILALRAHVSAGKPSGAHMGTHMYTNIYIYIYIYIQSTSVFVWVRIYGRPCTRARRSPSGAILAKRSSELQMSKLEYGSN